MTEANNRTRLLRGLARRKLDAAYTFFVASPGDGTRSALAVAADVHLAVAQCPPIVLDNLVGQHVHAQTGRLTDGGTAADEEGTVLAWEALAEAAKEKIQ